MTRDEGTRGGRRRLVLLGGGLLLLLVLSAALFLYVWWGGAEKGGPEVETAAPDSAGAQPGTRSMQLVFGKSDGTGLVTELRQLPTRDRVEDELQAAMEALCAGPFTRGAVSVIPFGARLAAVFYDEKTGAIVLDFSAELATNHPGGAAAERATVDAILRTVALNFPEVRSCLLLVGGAQLETLAGHIGLDRAFDPRRWL